VRRRDFLIGSSIVPLIAAPAASQQSPRAPRIGILTPAESADTAVFRAFREGLRDLGYVEGRTIILDFRFARGDYAVLPSLAAELVRLPVDVIVTDGGSVVSIARAATTTIPIVMSTTANDPVTAGLAASLSRPGGNITGFTLMMRELGPKRVELLHTAFPKASVITVLIDPSNPAAEASLGPIEATARSFGLKLVRVFARAFGASISANASSICSMRSEPCSSRSSSICFSRSDDTFLLSLGIIRDSCRSAL
jgi:putative ABC transport system substrate-binding protein